jgi:hypothetical protein
MDALIAIGIIAGLKRRDLQRHDSNARTASTSHGFVS